MLRLAPSFRQYSFVLDTSAVVAVLNGEDGQDVVWPVLHQSVISTVNWAEVITWLVDPRSPQHLLIDDALELVERFGLTTILFTEAGAEVAGLLQSETRSAGLSLGDRACISLAMELNLPVLTADRNWERVDVGADVRQIR